MKLPKIFINTGTREEKEYFIENLSMLLASGMWISRAISAIKSEIRPKKLQAIIDQLQNDIDTGLSISKALEKTNLIPSHIISLVRIGEESGRLPNNLQVIVEQQKKERVFRSKIQ